MAEPLTRRDRNAEATRRDILSAGREIFSQHPYSEVSGLQICNQQASPVAPCNITSAASWGYLWPYLRASNTAFPSK